jgi:hypothetical protein
LYVTLPSFAAAWLRERDDGARGRSDRSGAERRGTSGFVEQQRLFCRARK